MLRKRHAQNGRKAGNYFYVCHLELSKAKMFSFLLVTCRHEANDATIKTLDRA